MMNRAERRRQMRQKPAAKAPTQMQPDNTDTAIAEKIKRAEAQLEAMKNGKFNALLNLDTDGFQREMEKYEQARKIIEHNGITEKDLEESYEKGLRDGIHEAGLNITKCCYAAVCLALHDEFGFGAEMGISTGKMHARGPIGLEQLTSERYIVESDGALRK